MLTRTRISFTTLLPALARRCAAWAVGAALLFAAFGASAAASTSASAAMSKVSPDLAQALVASSVASLPWAKDTSAGRLVKVLVISAPTTDPDLTSLRSAIVGVGGSVYQKFISVNGVYALLPASRVLSIAQRGDVESISPNRMTVRTRSMLQSVTGSYESSGNGAVVSPGVDGSGVGIAFLDSGIMSTHAAFSGSWSGSRVKRSVDFQKITDSQLLGSRDWQGGYDFSNRIYPGSSALATLESLINSAGVGFQDPLGHGTIVASIAAGSDFYGTVDSTGIAPGASLFDVRVLNDQGVGDVADALSGIDWVIYHARDYGIRVLNISLAADSTDSYMTDPLCRAVRNAVAAGITVVVAAGNYGQDASGREVYGGISAPGNEPSAITVGSSNMHSTATRADDTVNFFSSRGPTLGGYVDAQGNYHPDDVLKPDLVAPGNHVIGALATDSTGRLMSQIGLQYPQLIVQSGGRVGTGLISVSGTSFSAPVVSGAVALMLQVNPGLTPPLVKAILQYTAEALPGYNLLEQGAGLRL